VETCNYDLFVANLLPSLTENTEIVFKVGQYLAKMWTRQECIPSCFLTHRIHLIAVHY